MRNIFIQAHSPFYRQFSIAVSETLSLFHKHHMLNRDSSFLASSFEHSKGSRATLSLKIPWLYNINVYGFIPRTSVLIPTH